VSGFCENGEELVGSIEVGECNGQVSDCELFEGDRGVLSYTY